MPNLSHETLSLGMQAALHEAQRWLGATSPNPPVGAAALDAEGRILAVAAHQKAGEAHAEAALLKICREQDLLDRIHTICCTLEPCNHHGRTPPCSEALIAAGIKNIAIGTRDPNPKAAGGVEKLRAADIEVIEGVEEELCRQLAHAFLYYAATGKPFITIKRAFDATGSMIPPVGQKTFTVQEQLILAHRMRKKADAIITGSGTILADNPDFTVRHVPDFADKQRVLAILDRRKRVPRSYIDGATARGFAVQIHDSVENCLSTLVKDGIRDILVESGPQLSQFMLDSGFWTLKVDLGPELHLSLQERNEFPFNINALNLDSILPL
jgi:diaminohydroxyphosphoribosylaminopyrimidine deaminase/5-amino-6-(5-phosphoribosylamino)uracil reductase